MKALTSFLCVLLLAVTNAFSSPMYYGENNQQNIKEKIVVHHFENVYNSPIQSFESGSNYMILQLQNRLITINQNRVTGIFNYETNNWESVPVEYNNLENILTKYYTIQMHYSPGHDPFIKLSLYDSTLDFDFYYEEYVNTPEGIMYFNKNETLLVKKDSAVLINNSNKETLIFKTI